MPNLLVQDFDGMVPRTEPHELADNQAQLALNAKLYAHELRPLLGSLVDGTAPILGVQTIYKLYNYSGSYKWLQFTNRVDIALAPTSDPGDVRFYYTGDGSPRKSNWTLAGTGNPPTTYYEMGVPAPTAAPTLTNPVAGTGSNETRAYVYTFVSTFGALTEESAPSPAASITVQMVGPTVHVTGLSAAPAGHYNITAVRIYRSITGDTTASYEFVAEIPIATTSYDDSLTVTQLGEVLPSIGWLPPPSTMTGLVNMGTGTGVLAGFFDNTVCFSEPFFPHAWPIAYQITVPYNIVGLGVVGSALVVLTTHYPFLVTGGIPGQMSVQRIPMLEPCVSKLSIVDYEDGVIYASPNGLITVSTDGWGNNSLPIFHREEWIILQPSSIAGGIVNGKYIGVFNGGPYAGFAIAMDPKDKPGYCQYQLDTALNAIPCIHVDGVNGTLWYVDHAGTGIYNLDNDFNVNNVKTYKWTSKRWYFPYRTSWSCMRMRADYTTGTASIDLYVDGSLLTTITPTSDDIIRLPPFKCRDFYFIVHGTMNIRNIQFATSVRELPDA